MRRLFEDKEIMNPINPEETFTCKDLVDGKVTFLSQSYNANQLILMILYSL